VAILFCGLSINASEPLTYSSELTKTDFQLNVDVMPAGNNTVQQLNLTEDFYYASQTSNLFDIRVFDSKNESLPFILVKEKKQYYTKIKDVKFYPLVKKESLASQTENTLLFYDEKHRLESIQKNKSDEKNTRVVGYLLDLGEHKGSELKANATNPIFTETTELIFSLSDIGKTGLLNFDIDSSSDLRSWRRVRNNETLAKLIYQDNLTLHNKIKLPFTGVRYLRLSIRDKNQQLLIESVIQNSIFKTSVKKQWSKEIDFVRDPNKYASNEVVNGRAIKNKVVMTAKIPYGMSLRKLRFVLKDAPFFIKGRVFYANGQTQQWEPGSHFELYNIINDGQVLTQKEFALNKNSLSKNSLNKNSASEIKLVLDYPAKIPDDYKLTASIGWHPEALVFLANGKAPYTIAVGNPDVDMLSISQQQLVHKLKNNLSESAKQMGVKQVTVIATSKNQPQPVSNYVEVDWAKIFLWSILIFGVIVMAWMARKLIKKIDA